MGALKRATSIHTEEENENLNAPFVLGHCLGNVHTLLVQGAFSIVESKEIEDVIEVQDLNDSDSVRHAKVGRLSQESSACSLSSRNSRLDSGLQYYDANFDIQNGLSIPSSAIWLIFECLKSIEIWLKLEIAPRNNSFAPDAISSSGSFVLLFAKNPSKGSCPPSHEPSPADKTPIEGFVKFFSELRFQKNL